MNIIRCSNGHFYDGDVCTQCPYCADKKMVEEEKKEKTDIMFPIKPQIMPSDVMQTGNAAFLKSKEDEPYAFISYAHADSGVVIDAIEFLKKNHFNIWYDEGIKSGYEWADEISRKIKHCKQFICFISPQSINSESVKDEIHIAWKYNINIIVVYLEKVNLDGGLEMKLDRKQAILKYSLNEQEFRKKLSSSISQDVVNFKNDKQTDDMRFNDRYEVIRMLSKGGTATTYLAKNKMTGVQVVLKHGTYDDTVSGQRIKRSFERERDTLSKNISPFLPCLYDYFYDAKNIYLAQSYIEGTAVSEMTCLSLNEKIEIFIKAAKVLKELHDRGIYHCDIKPEHIIVNRHGCFLIDFGSSEDLYATVADDVKMGTVTYAAPEQFVSYNGEDDIFGSYQDTVVYSDKGRNIDERTDIYALGKSMIKILSNTGNVVDYGVEADVTTVLFADVARTIGKFSNNPLLQAIIEKMVREKKKNRYSNMEEVIRVLEDFLEIYR